METKDPDTNYENVKKKCHKDRGRKELYLTLEFDGAEMYDKALAKAELAHRDFRDQMILIATGAFLGTSFAAIAGFLISCRIFDQL